jgi:hypothetical protein
VVSKGNASPSFWNSNKNKIVIPPPNTASKSLAGYTHFSINWIKCKHCDNNIQY